MTSNEDELYERLDDKDAQIAEQEKQLAALRALVVKKDEALQPVLCINASAPDTTTRPDLFERGCYLNPPQIRAMQEAIALTSADLAGCVCVKREDLKRSEQVCRDADEEVDRIQADKDSLRTHNAALTEELRVAKDSRAEAWDQNKDLRAELAAAEEARDKAVQSAILAVNIDRFDNPEVRRAFIQVIDFLGGKLMGRTFGKDKTSDTHLKWMLGECLLNIRTMPIDKMGRWVGFVQGVLVCEGILDVDDERDRTRPIFKKAYSTPSAAETAFRAAEIQIATLTASRDAAIAREHEARGRVAELEKERDANTEREHAAEIADISPAEKAELATKRLQQMTDEEYDVFVALGEGALWALRHEGSKIRAARNSGGAEK